MLRETTIDHVIPESLLDNPVELAKVKRAYALPATFDINSFENWLPAHDRCNRSKSNKVFDPAPILLDVLRTMARKAPELRAAEARLLAQRKVDDLLGKLLVAVDIKAIDRNKILAAFADPELRGNTDAQVLEREFQIHIDPLRWKLVQASGSIATVTDGRLGGMTPTGNSPDPSWICPTCGTYGPWNGAMCISCGRMSDPYD